MIYSGFVEWLFIFAIGFVMFVVLCCVDYKILSGIMDEDITIKSKLILATIALIPFFIVTLIILVSEVEMIGYYIKMNTGDYIYISGRPKIINCEQNYARGTEIDDDYSLELMINEEYINIDVNGIDSECIRKIEESESIKVIYGYIDNKVFVWKIVVDE